MSRELVHLQEGSAGLGTQILVYKVAFIYLVAYHRKHYEGGRAHHWYSSSV